MIQLADLLFYTNGKNELTFEQRVNIGESIVPSDHSFEQVLKNYQESNEPLQNGKTPNNYSGEDNQKVTTTVENTSIKKEHEVEIEDKNPDIDSDNTLKEFPAEWLLSLLTGQLEDGNISEDSYIDVLKIMAPSLQKAMAQNSMLSSIELTEELKNIVESLLLKMKIDGVETGIDIDQESNLMGDLENTQYLDMVQDILTGKEHLYDSSVEAIPKQIMSAMQMAGLGKKALISYIDDKAIDEVNNNTDEQNSLVRLTQTQDFDSKYTSLKKLQNIQSVQKIQNVQDEQNIKDDIKIIQSFGENSNMDYDPSENGSSRLEISDMSLVEPVNASSGTEFLDITKILDNNNSTASIEIIRDLAEKISMNLKNNHYEIELQVKPEHLGRLILKVTLEDGVLAGKIYTTSQQTGDILQNNLNDLRNALEEQGYSFSQLDVNVGNEGNGEQFQQSNRDGLNIGNAKTSRNIFDHLEEQMEEDSELAPKYTGSSEIDYFA